MRTCAIVLLAALVTACGGDDATSDVDAAPPPRLVVLETQVDASGLSPEVTFTLPETTRSVTVVVEGAPAALYALGALTFADGTDQVGLPAGAPGPAMQAMYRDEQIGQMPGSLLQSIRLGTFTHVYPYRPDQALVPGTASLRVASDTPGPVRVTVLLPEENGARVLPLNVFVVSDTLPMPATDQFTTELSRILAQAGVTVRVAHMERLAGTALAQITMSTEPQEAPDSQAAMLPALVGDHVAGGLDLFYVESLPAGIAGLSLGTPGPPVRGSYYFGVLWRSGLGSTQAARVVAHEVSHFLALQHLVNTGVSGATYPDPLDDTTPGEDNLMEDGTLLTPGQAFALQRSALLVAE
ncbi:MAG: hypothetical protein K8M05_05015 [Deltaproteobacteria bacterium]|nr:hypothetical protein [Kofleriaceae bacterium]